MAEPMPRAARIAFFSEGTVLQNRYKIERIVSTSGTGQVYRARDLRFPGNLWIVKAYKKFPAEAWSVAMRTLAGCHHPNLVSVSDFFDEGEHSCVVMELIHGRSLEQILEETDGPLPERQVLSWGVQCADALLYLRRRMKNFSRYSTLSPRRILISDVGELKLLPKLPDTLENHRVPGVMGYAPPEAYDEKGHPDERSDVYTLGAVLHRSLSGGNPAAVPFVFVPLGPVNSNLESGIERVLEKATQANPGKRHASLSEFRSEIYGCLQEVLRIQFHLSGRQGFSDAFWWTLIVVLSASVLMWFHIVSILIKSHPP